MGADRMVRNQVYEQILIFLRDCQVQAPLTLTICPESRDRGVQQHSPLPDQQVCHRRVCRLSRLPLRLRLKLHPGHSPQWRRSVGVSAASVQGQIDFVFSHPNGWEGTQQSQMRRAAVLGWLSPDTPAENARLSFVTEGEASLHFSIHNGLPAGAMKVCF